MHLVFILFISYLLFQSSCSIHPMTLLCVVVAQFIIISKIYIQYYITLPYPPPPSLYIIWNRPKFKRLLKDFRTSVALCNKQWNLLQISASCRNIQKSFLHNFTGKNGVRGGCWSQKDTWGPLDRFIHTVCWKMSTVFGKIYRLKAQELSFGSFQLKKKKKR